MYRYLWRHTIMPFFFTTPQMKSTLPYFLVFLLLFGCQNETKLTFESYAIENEVCDDCPEVSIVIPKALGQAKLSKTINTALKEELISMNYELDKISMAYAKELQKTEEQKEKINTAYYAIGTFKELKNANILTKKGSFIGMGGARALVEDFNKDQFIEIDITEVKDILIDAKKAQLATNHAEGSYEFEEVDGVVTKLVILDPVEFWSVSKFLVIVK